ncbi:MAG: class A beta-lactamase-related serine hydrolase [Spirochaetia bacterium]|nr:class A beta-lactamase-related serine hydrolase [Spirochaetia bacterium]
MPRIKRLCTSFLKFTLFIASLSTAGCLAPVLRDSYLPHANSPLLTAVLKGPAFQAIMADPDRRRLQIIFSQIHMQLGKPILTHHTFRLREREFFYPASLVKIAPAALSLEKLKDLKHPGLTPKTLYNTEITVCPPTEEDKPRGGQVTTPPTIERDIRAIFLVSDNQAYDRLYSFLGQDMVNATMTSRGYRSFQMTHRLGRKCSMLANQTTDPVVFTDDKGTQIYRQESFTSHESYEKRRDGWDVVSGYDGAKRNSASLADLHKMLIALIMPEALPEHARFRLSDTELKSIQRSMSMYPEEEHEIEYDTSRFHGGKSKYLLLGGQPEQAPKNIRIFNKVGMALGFLTDTAFVVDYEHETGFFLSATVYVNDKHSDVDEDHLYETLGLPFMAALGTELLKIENERNDTFGVSRYQFEY